MSHPRYNNAGERIVRGPYRRGLERAAAGLPIGDPADVERAPALRPEQLDRRDRSRARRYVSRALVVLVRRAVAASACRSSVGPRERRAAIRARAIAIVTDVLLAAARAAIFCAEEALR